MIDFLQTRGAYLVYAVIVALGVCMILVHRNLLKSLVGISVLQSGIILFFILLSVRSGGSVPILPAPGGAALHNPLPHALMLTAIVVGVATLGLGIALLLRLQAEEGSIEEPPPRSGDA